MKKRISCFTAFFMLASMLLAGCGQGSNLKFATGGVTGTYYPYGGAVAAVINSVYSDIKFDVQATGASAANIRLVAGNEVDIAIVQNDVMSYAYTGTETFAGDKVDNFAAMATVYAEVCQIIVDPASGIETIADLKGKRVSVGDAGSGVEANAKQILAAYGISFEDITKQNLSFGDSANAMKDKKIDAFFVTAGTPTTAVMELASTNPFKMLSIDAATADKLMADYSFYTKYTIPAGTYSSVTEDIETLAVKATLIVSTKLSEDTVYKMTKALFENKDAVVASHAKGAELDVNAAVEGLSVPLHSGATKYFKEAGVLK